MISNLQAPAAILQWGAKSMNPNASTGLIGLARTGMCYDAAFILQF
jgi:hypothetical protein